MLSVDSSNQQAMMRSKLCPRHLFLQTHKRAFVPANTQKNTGWAHKVFLDWCAVRNKLLTNNTLWICSIKLMLVNWTTNSHASLSRWEGRMDSHIPQNHLPDTCWLKANDDRQKPRCPKVSGSRWVLFSQINVYLQLSLQRPPQSRHWHRCPPYTNIF